MRLISAWVYTCMPARFPTKRFRQFCGAWSRSSLLDRASYRITRACWMAFSPFTVISSGSPGPAPTSVTSRLLCLHDRTIFMVGCIRRWRLRPASPCGIAALCRRRILPVGNIVSRSFLVGSCWLICNTRALEAFGGYFEFAGFYKMFVEIVHDAVLRVAIHVLVQQDAFRRLDEAGVGMIDAVGPCVVRKALRGPFQFFLLLQTAGWRSGRSLRRRIRPRRSRC